MSKVTILVVEDDAIEAMDIKRTLESTGYAIYEIVSSGEEAIEKLSEFKPDLVLMDIVLSGELDGIDTAEIIKNVYNIPVIYLTAYYDEITVERAKLTEPYAYLVKPFDSIELRRIIEISLYKHEMELKLEHKREHFENLFENAPIGIFHSSPEGKLFRVNKKFSDIYGYGSPEEMINVVNQTSVGEKLYVDPVKRPVFVDEVFEDEKWHSYNNRYYRKDGSIMTAELSFRAVKDQNSDVKYLEGFVKDITESKRFEKELKDSIREKEVLLQEIHHRVKNNMQIISSLLNIQTRYVDDEESVNVLKESQNRVKSMAIIHEKLYRSGNFNKIYFADYIESLVWDLFYSYSVEKGTITPVLEIDDVKLNIETSVPCGLIITELVSNSLKYAFPDQRKGELKVSLKDNGENYVLTISDNGVGIPENIDFKNTDSLGLQLVNSLTDQIDGEIEIETSSHGTKFKITFQELVYKERI